MCSHIGLHSISMSPFQALTKTPHGLTAVSPVCFYQGTGRIIHLMSGTNDLSPRRRKVPANDDQISISPSFEESLVFFMMTRWRRKSPSTKEGTAGRYKDTRHHQHNEILHKYRFPTSRLLAVCKGQAFLLSLWMLLAKWHALGKMCEKTFTSSLAQHIYCKLYLPSLKLSSLITKVNPTYYFYLIDK